MDAGGDPPLHATVPFLEMQPMSTTNTRAAFCREQADQAQAAAAVATLDNVRDRCLRSMAVWQDLADRAERVDAERRVREAATAASTTRAWDA